MKDKFTIGEVARLLNLSAQTLRYYDRIGVVVPEFVDQKTGYRYYSYDQIQYIGRIRYLQRFGFPLEEIRDALESNDIGHFRKTLQKRQAEIRQEIREREETLAELDWYLSYYDHARMDALHGVPNYRHEEVRWILAEPLQSGEDIYGTAGMRLTELMNSEPFSSLSFLRQVGYLLDFQSLLDGRIVPTHYYTFVHGIPSIRHQKLLRIPDGEYLSVQSRILVEKFDADWLKSYFERQQSKSNLVREGTGLSEEQIRTNGPNKTRSTTPLTGTVPLVLANEYEDNFTDFRNCIYEIQIRIA